MPKLKSHRGAAKRFKVRGNGNGVKFRKANRNHILTSKPTQRKRHLRTMGVMKACDVVAAKRMLHGS
ncbi:MAG: 50S ribosomal protein L35 [Gammaproteobacteria bacterium]|nr:50S ribosomal protein L35 [Gammaproteobacteria bacterium]